MKLTTDSDRCTGCAVCELWCMNRHEGVRRKLRVRIVDRKALVGRDIRICRQCDDRVCIAACPSDALVVDESTGAMSVGADACTGCGLCAEACPHSAIAIVDDVAVICDLCGGKPACVAACPEKVITIK